MTGRTGSATPRIILALVALVVLAGIVIGAVQLTGNGKAAADAASLGADGEWYDVKRTSFDLTVVATGELEAKNQVEVKSKVDRRVPLLEVIDEGTFVQKGDVLGKLDPTEVEERIEEETLEVEQAKASKISAEQELVIAQNESASEKRAAEVKLDLAELDLAKWQEGEVAQKKLELELALAKAERRLERAKEDLGYSQDLYDQKFISRSELDDDELEKTEAEAALETAQKNIEVYNKYTYQRDEKQKQSDLDQATAELERTIRKNESKLARLAADLESKKRSLTLREERLGELQEQLEASTILAPEKGLVVYASSVGPHWRRRDPIAPGREIRNDETIFLLPDTRQMVAALRVHEALLPQVEKGQPVSITVDARPGESIQATVSKIAVMAEDGGWLNPQLREYMVRAEMPYHEDGSGLKPGMRCTGEIKVGRAEEAIAVPVQAVFTEGDQQFCYVPANGGVKRRPVTIGKSSETMVEIVDGLDVGDAVLLRNPRPGEVVDG